MSPAKMFFAQTTKEFFLSGSIADMMVREQSGQKVLYLLKTHPQVLDKVGSGLKFRGQPFSENV